MATIELELSYLAASLPSRLAEQDKIELTDIYFPAASEHARLRIRRKNEQYELTKKSRVSSDDASIQTEETIILTAEEFAALAEGKGREVSKTRYLLPYQGYTAEIDIFSGALEGLVIVEFEFSTAEEKEAFTKPDFCLVDVTQEDFIAGGVLAGKTYMDISSQLEEFGYRKISIQRESSDGNV